MDLESLFKNLGGTFIVPSREIMSYLPDIKVFIFDWDGVFNNGVKTGEEGSPFSEIDSMGINMLRFSYYLKYGNIPLFFIVTGMNNHSALDFAKREHFDGIFMNLKNKRSALESISETFKINPDKASFFFDDIIDIEVARKCRLSFFINNRSNPLLLNYIKINKIASYISAFPAVDHAIREICELLTGLNGNYDETVEKRSVFSGEYDEYLRTRNEKVTKNIVF
jgi:3-deoxy-D-manno-octulosonate 8-phosphate phosphatase (KDO 8-P phosphatase)